jgi:hypothetical protein
MTAADFSDLRLSGWWTGPTRAGFDSSLRMIVLEGKKARKDAAYQASDSLFFFV